MYVQCRARVCVCARIGTRVHAPIFLLSPSLSLSLPLSFRSSRSLPLSLSLSLSLVFPYHARLVDRLAHTCAHTRAHASPSRENCAATYLSRPLCLRFYMQVMFCVKFPSVRPSVRPCVRRAHDERSERNRKRALSLALPPLLARISRNRAATQADFPARRFQGIGSPRRNGCATANNCDA